MPKAKWVVSYRLCSKFLRSPAVQKLENRLRFHKVTVSLKVGTVFLRHSIVHYALRVMSKLAELLVLEKVGFFEKNVSGMRITSHGKSSCPMQMGKLMSQLNLSMSVELITVPKIKQSSSSCKIDSMFSDHGVKISTENLVC